MSFPFRIGMNIASIAYERDNGPMRKREPTQRDSRAIDTRDQVEATLSLSAALEDSDTPTFRLQLHHRHPCNFFLLHSAVPGPGCLLARLVADNPMASYWTTIKHVPFATPLCPCHIALPCRLLVLLFPFLP